MPSRLFRGCTSSLTPVVLKELFCLGVDEPESNICEPDQGPDVEDEDEDP